MTIMTVEEANMALGCSFRPSLTTFIINITILDHHNLSNILINPSSIRI